jgi:hypothetical protein
MYSDSIRIRVSCDSEDEFAKFMLFCRQSGLKIEPFAYRNLQGQKPILRMKIKLPPGVKIPDGLDLENPTELDFRD